MELKTPTQTEQPVKIPRVGFLSTTSAPTRAAPAPFLEAFRRGLCDLGYVEGRNVVTESRFAEGQLDRLRDLTVELVRLRVDGRAVGWLR